MVGGFALYAYVKDVNKYTDIFGLLASKITFLPENLHPKTVTPANPLGIYEIHATGTYRGDKMALYGAADLKESFDSSKWIAHHIDYDPETNIMRMQLVELKKHQMDHIGGVKDFQDFHKVKYDTAEAIDIVKSCK